MKSNSRAQCAVANSFTLSRPHPKQTCVLNSITQNMSSLSLRHLTSLACSTSGLQLTRSLHQTSSLFGGVKFNATEGELEEILSKHLVKPDPDASPRILTTRREALSLYREIIRMSVLFVWRDPAGRQWREVIRESARKEFDLNRHLSDPVEINKLILSGREALDQAMDMFMAKRAEIMRKDGTGGDQVGGSKF